MADLTITVSESVVLNGATRGNTITKTITGIESVFERIVSVPNNADTTILVTKNTVADSDSGVDIQNTKYIRISNLDSTNSVILSLQVDINNDSSDAEESCSILLEAGKTFMLGTPHECIDVNDTNANIQTSLKDLESILVDSGGNTVKLELFVAGA